MKEQEKINTTLKRDRYSWSHYFKIGATVFLTVAACITFFFVIYRWEVVAGVGKTIIKSAEPIIIGLVLAYLLMPVKNFVETPILKIFAKKNIQEEKAKKMARGISITASLIFLFIIIAILIAIMVPALITSVAGLIETMPGYISSFVSWIQEKGTGDGKFALFVGEAIRSVMVELENWAKAELLPLAQQYIGTITSGVLSAAKSLLNFVIGIIVVVYVMSIEETMVGQAKKIIYAIFPTRTGNAIIHTVRKSNEIFSGFIVGKIIDSAIIGVICYFGCVLLKIPSAVLVAFIVGITNVIPFFGPFIGAIPSVLLVLIQSPIHGVYLAIFILVLQQVDGNIIGPKILGDTTGLSSFWVLTSILVAGGLFGFFGMLLGVPVFAVIYYIFQQVLSYRMKKKEISDDTTDYVDLIEIDEDTKTMKYREEDQQENQKAENQEQEEQNKIK